MTKEPARSLRARRFSILKGREENRDLLWMRREGPWSEVRRPKIGRY